jgi:hypothetical protein
MTTRTILTLFILMLSSAVSAEGVWQVKGHAFSNVHAWQKGAQVRVSGRVSGGPAREPFTAFIHVQDDEGRTRQVTIRKKRFSGQGETFEGHFRAARRSRWWQIIQIEVVGSDPAEVRRLQTPPNNTQVSAPPTAADSVAMPESGPARFFPIRKNAQANTPTVLFSSMRPVCVTVRDHASGRLVLMKNVTPHDLKMTSLPCGDYSANIVGNGFTTRKNFSIPAPGDIIDLN